MSWWLGGELGPEGVLRWTAPPWAMALSVAAALLVLLLAWRSGRRAGPVWPELLALAVGLAALLTMIAGPTWVEDAGHTEPGRAVVLIDDSRSLSVLEGGSPRSDQVKAALDAAGPGAELFRFGSELSVGGEPTFTQGYTDIGQALSTLAERYAGERLRSVVLITDGIDRGGLRRRYAESVQPPPLLGPLTIYQVGEPSQLSDLAVAGLDAGGFAFIRTPFTISARIEGRGFEGRSIPVTLTRDGQLVSTSTVRLGEDGKATADFRVVPPSAGRFVYEVSIPVWDGDAVPGNNAMPVAVRVMRDRIRVLQVCGSPSFDQKFLRLFLKQDPAVDLVSFFILRTNEDANLSMYNEDELALIKFPYDQLFTTELDSFDLVIFQNFDYKPYFATASDKLLGNVADYVRDGGAFVMLGGSLSFDRGSYGGTPLGDVLPVTLGASGEAVNTDSFSPALTAAGKAHPVTRLVGDGASNEATWSRLAALDGLNLSTGLAKGAAMLLAHPSLKTASGGPMPVLAVREVNKGRTMALMGDSSWRWVMAEAAAGQGNQAYLRFWKNAIRWLVKDPEGERVQVEPGRENYIAGEPVSVRVQVRDVGFQPIQGATITGSVTGPGEALTLDATTDAYGEAVITLPALQPGPWRVKVQASRGDATLGRAGSVFAVTSRDPELDEVIPDAVFLERLASSVGGTLYRPGQYGPPVRDEAAGRRVEARQVTPLWAAPLLPLIAGISLSLSWWLRRRRGLR